MHRHCVGSYMQHPVTYIIEKKIFFFDICDSAIDVDLKWIKYIQKFVTHIQILNFLITDLLSLHKQHFNNKKKTCDKLNLLLFFVFSKQKHLK